MAVPVMDIRDVRVKMLAALVFMFVPVAECAGKATKRIVRMVVMPFPVPMPMRMDGLRVDMAVRMAVPEQESPGEPLEAEGKGARDGRELSEE